VLGAVTSVDSHPMNAPDAFEDAAPPRGQVFRYEGFATNADYGTLTCRYSVDGRDFVERVSLEPGAGWQTPAAQAAARLVYLLAGVSYYKTAAPPLIDLGPTALTAPERGFLRDFYVSGLAEYAYRNHIDLSSLRITAPEARESDNRGAIGPWLSQPREPERAGAGRSGAGHAGAEHGEAEHAGRGLRPLIPFGGGIDSIVTLEGMRRHSADAALFVVSRAGDRFNAIEWPAAVSGLPVVRAGRKIDPQLMRSAELGFLNGHVPVTGIISAIAVLAAVLSGRDAVIMSNEWSASVPTLEDNGQQVNHQWSKSADFEAGFRALLRADPAGLPDYFSALRDRTELWVGERFAGLTQYHATFRSCNRAFHLDTTRRLAYWCGQCDKCCFIDLILAPFMSAGQLRAVFAAGGGGGEPLGDPALKPRFETLLGSGTKPFECVGEVSECRAAVLLAAQRPDRAETALLQELAAAVAARPDVPGAAEIEAMRHPVGSSFVPPQYALGAA
jgi:UDP-N-acetyl-alpha-D-muramoyl-L-alanyl-L-glutamate epimerase